VTNFFGGFLNGTGTLTTQNMTLCEKVVMINWQNNLVLIYNYTAGNEPWLAGWSLLDIIYNVDTVSRYCYTAIYEGALGLENYGLQLYPSAIMNNVVYNFGDIFDSVRDSLIMLLSNPQGEGDLVFKSGFGLGYALFLAMKPPVNPKPKPIYSDPTKPVPPSF